MAIVIPAKDGKLQLFEGVISGVPHDCSLIVVSASSRKRVDRFKLEKDALEQFCRHTQRTAYIIHQKDAAIAEIAKQVGYTDLIDQDGLVRNGKSEGMIMGLLMALVLRKKYIGFIDADRLGYTFALGVAVVVVLFWNFLINRIWTYNDVQ